MAPALVSVQLLGPGILPHHCNLMHSEGMVTVTPHGPDADTFVDGQRVTETTVLRSGSTLQFGSAHVFKFVDPMFDQGGKREPAAIMRSRHKSGWGGGEVRVRVWMESLHLFNPAHSHLPLSLLLFFLLPLFFSSSSCDSSSSLHTVFPSLCVIVDEGRRGWGLGLAGRARDEGKEKGEEGSLGLDRWGEWGKWEERKNGGLGLWQAGFPLIWWCWVWPPARCRFTH